MVDNSTFIIKIHNWYGLNENLTQCHWEDVMYTILLFCEIHQHIAGSKELSHQGVN